MATKEEIGNLRYQNWENPEGEIVSNKLILTDKIVEVDG